MEFGQITDTMLNRMPRFLLWDRHQRGEIHQMPVYVVSVNSDFQMRVQGIDGDLLGNAFAVANNDIAPFDVTRDTAGILLERNGDYYDQHMPKVAQALKLAQELRDDPRSMPFIAAFERELGAGLNLEQLQHEMIGRVDRMRFISLLRVAARSDQGHCTVSDDQVDDCLSRWAEAKWPYYLAFDKELRISTVIADENKDYSPLYIAFARKYPQYAVAMSGLDANKACRNEIGLLTIWSPKEITRHAKATSLFHYLFDDPKFDADFAMLLEHCIATDNIHLSIDPFDYLTMSVNQHNWTSCHNIVSGMYTTGSFAYLTDKSTLIAYREDGLEREYRLGSNRFMGNSKRWRQCVYVDERTGAAIFGRQYPNTQSGTTEAIRMLYERQMSQFFRQEDRWLCSTNGRLYTYERRTEMCYHDVTHGYQYELTMPETCASIPHFSVGSIVFCPGCGTEISNTGRISCDSCNHENRRVA